MSFWSDCYGYTMGMLREIWMLISRANIFVVSVFFILFILLFCFLDKKLFNKSSVTYIVMSSLYATFLITITVLGRLPECSSSFNNLFLTYIKYSNGDLGAKYDIIYNILLFIPVGLLANRYKRIKYNLIFLIILPFAIEIIQLITSRGVFELTDIINNFIGGVIGLGIARLIGKLIRLIKVKRKGGTVERAE